MVKSGNARLASVVALLSVVAPWPAAAAGWEPSPLHKALHERRSIPVPMRPLTEAELECIAQDKKAIKNCFPEYTENREPEEYSRPLKEAVEEARKLDTGGLEGW